MEAAAREPVRWDLARQRDSLDWAAREREERRAKRMDMVGSCMVMVSVFGTVGDGLGVGLEFCACFERLIGFSFFDGWWVATRTI